MTGCSRKAGLVLIWLSFLNADLSGQSSPAIFTPARPTQCPDQDCSAFDAIVFVHGIYGNAHTFVNSNTHFDWPAMFPKDIEVGPHAQARVDVFVLEYRTALVAWAKGSNPGFDEVALAMFNAMAPLRKRQYRSIGFIAHSLGGNVVSTYIELVLHALGHPQRAQNAFVITLATA